MKNSAKIKISLLGAYILTACTNPNQLPSVNLQPEGTPKIVATTSEMVDKNGSYLGAATVEKLGTNEVLERKKETQETSLEQASISAEHNVYLFKN